MDGERNGLTDDLDAAMAAGQKPLEIINSTLLAGMKTVGELFGHDLADQPPIVPRQLVRARRAVERDEPIRWYSRMTTSPDRRRPGNPIGVTAAFDAFLARLITVTT